MCVYLRFFVFTCSCLYLPLGFSLQFVDISRKAHFDFSITWNHGLEILILFLFFNALPHFPFMHSIAYLLAVVFANVYWIFLISVKKNMFLLSRWNDCDCIVSFHVFVQSFCSCFNAVCFCRNEWTINSVGIAQLAI